MFLLSVIFFIMTFFQYRRIMWHYFLEVVSLVYMHSVQSESDVDMFFSWGEGI